MESDFKSKNSWERDEAFGLKISVKGIIDSSFKDYRNHNIPTAKLTNGELFYLPCFCTSEFIKGDSIVKLEGSMNLYKFRNDHLMSVYSYYTKSDSTHKLKYLDNLDSIKLRNPKVIIK